MSSEVSNTNSSTSLASYALMPSVYVGVNAINNARYFKNPVKPLGNNAKKFGDLTKKLDVDTFQKAQFTSESFEVYRRARIDAKKLEKLQNGKLPLKDRFFNLFRKNKVTGQEVIKRKNLGNAKDNLNKIENAIKNNDIKTLQKTMEGMDEGYKNAVNFIDMNCKGKGIVKSFGTQAFNNFKKEFSFKKGNRFNAGFNVAMTALQFIPNITQKVIPAFQNNGFKAGMTELGQTVVQAGADLVSYAAGGALGRTIGSALGAFVGPMGAFVGGLVGDMVGSMFVGSKVCGVVEKITNKDDVANTGNIELAQDNVEMAGLENPTVIAQENPQMLQDTNYSDVQISNEIEAQDNSQQLAYAQIQAQAQADEIDENQQTARKLDINPNSLNNPEVRHAAYARANAQRNYLASSNLNSFYA